MAASRKSFTTRRRQALYRADVDWVYTSEVKSGKGAYHLAPRRGMIPSAFNASLIATIYTASQTGGHRCRSGTPTGRPRSNKLGVEDIDEGVDCEQVMTSAELCAALGIERGVACRRRRCPPYLAGEPVPGLLAS
jgi:hypothetical protein